MSPPRILTCTVYATLVLLFFGILTVWVPGVWASGTYQMAACLIGLIWCALVVCRAAPARITPATLLLVGTIVWGFVQIVSHNTIYQHDTYEWLAGWSANVVLFFLGQQIAFEPKQLRKLLRAIFYFGVAVAILGTVQMFTSGGRVFWLFPSGYNDFVFGPFVYRNQFAAFVELIIPLTVYFGLVSYRDELIYTSLAAVLLGCVVASTSRAGIVLAFSEVVVLTFLANRADLLPAKRLRKMMFRTVGMAALVCLVVGAGAAWHRWSEANPLLLRREVMTSAVHMIRDRPAFGFGMGTWAVAYPAYAVYDPGAIVNQAHNDWVQWTVEGGLPFVAMMLVFAALIFKPAVRSLWGVGVFAFMLHALVDYPFQQQRPGLAGLFFVMAGALAVQRRHPLQRAPSRPVKG